MNDTAELVAKLKKAGHSVRETWIREDGKVIFSVDGVFMFKHDVVDVAQGRATAEQIKKRNKERVFPRPLRSKA